MPASLSHRMTMLAHLGKQEAPRLHLWVRFGGATFCGKKGCGLIKNEKTQRLECEGIESPGIRLLRNL